MEQTARRIEIRTADGKPILSLYIYDNGALEAGNQKDRRPEEKKDKAQGGSNGETPMTDAQKRFLFRILADQNIEGEKAHDKLKELFQVDTLKEVTKTEASRMIERLLEDAKVGKGNGGKDGNSGSAKTDDRSHF